MTFEGLGKCIYHLYYCLIMFSTLPGIQKAKDRAPRNRWDTATCCDLHHLLTAQWTMGDDKGLYCLSHIRSVPKPPAEHGSPVFQLFAPHAILLSPTLLNTCRRSFLEYNPNPASLPLSRSFNAFGCHACWV